MESNRLYTYHAVMRMSQRGISIADVEYVLDYGTWIWRAGLVHVYLRRRDIPPEHFRKWPYREGIQVRLSPDYMAVVTAFKNRGKGAIGQIRRKAKRKSSGDLHRYSN